MIRSAVSEFFCLDGQTLIMNLVRVYFQVLFRKLQKLHFYKSYLFKKIKAENVLFYTQFYKFKHV